MSEFYNPEKEKYAFDQANPKKRYAEEIFESLPEVEMGSEIPKVSLTRLAAGKDAELKLSAREYLERQGWDVDSLAGAGKGSLILHAGSGTFYEVLEVQKGRMKIKDVSPETFGMYLMAFKYGMPEEGGFSFGLERLTMKLLELSNVREASLFPRDMERVDERFSKEEIEKKSEKKQGKSSGKKK